MWRKADDNEKSTNFVPEQSQMTMKIEVKSLERLKESVEKVVGRTISTPRDFNILSIHIYNLTKEHLSSTTLKRLWGYQLDQKDSSPRILTLDTLARAAGYKDYASFQTQALEDTGCESYFINNKHLYTSNLCMDDKIRLTWKPNRCVTIQYKGRDMFKVVDSVNSKLDVGDMFQCAMFIHGEPLILSHLIREGAPTMDYVCGRTDGITFDKL